MSRVKASKNWRAATACGCVWQRVLSPTTPCGLSCWVVEAETIFFFLSLWRAGGVAWGVPEPAVRGKIGRVVNPPLLASQLEQRELSSLSHGLVLAEGLFSSRRFEACVCSCSRLLSRHAWSLVAHRPPLAWTSLESALSSLRAAALFQWGYPQRAAAFATVALRGSRRGEEQDFRAAVLELAASGDAEGARGCARALRAAGREELARELERWTLAVDGTVQIELLDEVKTDDDAAEKTES